MVTAVPVTRLAGEHVARQMLRRQLDAAVRPDVAGIAEATGLTAGRVTALLDLEVARRRHAPDPGSYAAGLLAAADELDAQAHALRRMAATLPRDLAAGVSG